MQAMALPLGLRRFTLADLPRERWRNGAGWTRPIASAHADADADGPTLWRVSLAEISQAAPFSTFAGMDRTAVLAAGGPVRLLRLQGGEQAWALNAPGDVARFPGEWVLANEAPEQPALIWNVMTGRGGVQAEVSRCDGQAWTAPAGAVCWAWVLRGSFAYGGADDGDQVNLLGQLHAGEGLQVDAQGAGPTLSPMSADASLLVTLLRGPQA